MSEDRYIPKRRCIACRQTFSQNTLFRIIDTVDGLRISSDNRLFGRSCYICRNAECVKKAFNKKCFAGSLKHSVSKEELSELKEEIDKIL